MSAPEALIYAAYACAVFAVLFALLAFSRRA